MSDFWKNLNSDEFEAALAENLQMLTIRRPVTKSRRPTILCLGESHGAHVFAMSQKVLPGTGGLLINLPEEVGPNILLDPGWGTVAAAHRLGVRLDDIGLILISHCHLDHVADLNPTLGTLSLLGKAPVLVGNTTALMGAPGQPSVLPDYFRRLCESVLVASSGKTIRTKGIEVLPFQTNHTENAETEGRSLSYILSLPGRKSIRIGLVTDGPLGKISDKIMDKLRRCEVLVMNIGTCSTQPRSPSHSKVYDNALCLHGLRDFIEALASEPSDLRMLGITHLGAELIEVRSKRMLSFLAKMKCNSPIELIEPAVSQMANELMSKEIEVRVLREGNILEV